MSIEQKIQESAKAAVKALYGIEADEKTLQLQKTRSEFEGNLTLVVFPFVKAARKKPEMVAEEIGQHLVENSGVVSGFNVVKGFLNLSIAQAAWRELLAEIDADEHYGEKAADDNAPLVIIAKHKQTAAPGTRAQQPAGLGSRTSDAG